MVYVTFEVSSIRRLTARDGGISGLCSMGISGKHILKTFGEFKDIKVR